MTKDNFQKADIGLKFKGKEIKFSIIHNLPNQFGLSINDALENWLARTNEYTAESFCEYVQSKETDFIALTEEQYNDVLKNHNEELLRENIKVIKTLREQYKNSRYGKPFEEERRIWENIKAECEKRKISIDLIQMDEEVFNQMTEQVILSYLIP